MYNKIIIAGNLGRDPESRFTNNGKQVTSFPLAVNNPFKKDDNPMWVKVSMWGRMAEVCNEHLEKGRAVLVEGRLNYDADTGNPTTYKRKDGTTAAAFEMTADNVVFMNITERKETTDRGGAYEVEDEDPPF